MKLSIFAVVSSALAPAFAAAPQVSNVTMSQDLSARTEITYELTGAPAIVTVDIQTNANASGEASWVSIGAENLVGISGDVHCKVDVTGEGEHRTIIWHPETDWPGKRITSGTRAVVKAWPTNSPPNWMVIDLRTPFTVAWYPDAALIPHGGVTNKIYKSEYLVMRRIPAKGVVWTMGTRAEDFHPESTDSHKQREKILKVCLSDDYYIGIYELTADQYIRVTDANGYVADSTTGRKPKTGASFGAMRGSTLGRAWPVITNGEFDFAESSKVDNNCWLDKFRKRYAAYGIRIDFPTSAQWEYACRAGVGKPLYSGESYTAANVAKIARYTGNSTQTDCEGIEYASAGACTVGSYAPNNWGLYDMLGNIQEQCLDIPEDRTLLDNTKIYVDYIGKTNRTDSSARNFPGGYHSSVLRDMRCGWRTSYNDTNERYGTQGFRLVWTLR